MIPTQLVYCSVYCEGKIKNALIEYESRHLNSFFGNLFLNDDHCAIERSKRRYLFRNKLLLRSDLLDEKRLPTFAGQASGRKMLELIPLMPFIPYCLGRKK